MKFGLYIFLFIVFSSLGIAFLAREKELSPNSRKVVSSENQVVSKPHSVTEDQVSCHPIFPVKGKYLVVPTQEEEESDRFSNKLSFLFESGWPRTICTGISSFMLLYLSIRAIRIKKARAKKYLPL